MTCISDCVSSYSLLAQRITKVFVLCHFVLSDLSPCSVVLLNKIKFLQVFWQYGLVLCKTDGDYKHYVVVCA